MFPLQIGIQDAKRGPDGTALPASAKEQPHAILPHAEGALRLLPEDVGHGRLDRRVVA